jgi:ferredoxin
MPKQECAQNGYLVKGRLGSIDKPIDRVIYYFVVGTIFALSLFVGRRALCHYGCWMAPFMIIGRKIRNTLNTPALRLRANTAGCRQCAKCTRGCPMSLPVHKMVKRGVMENRECILCGTCIDHCPHQVIATRLAQSSDVAMCKSQAVHEITVEEHLDRLSGLIAGRSKPAGDVRQATFSRNSDRRQQAILILSFR